MPGSDVVEPRCSRPSNRNVTGASGRDDRFRPLSRRIECALFGLAITRQLPERREICRRREACAAGRGAKRRDDPTRQRIKNQMEDLQLRAAGERDRKRKDCRSRSPQVREIEWRPTYLLTSARMLLVS